METCKRCNKNQFDPWYAKDKGQKFPFKSCPPCRQKAKEQREQQNQGGGSNQELQELRDVVFGLEKRVLALEMGYQKPKTVSEDETPDVENIPF